MAAASTLKNMALCLTAVCLICSAVVGGAYAVTKDPIDAAAQAKTTASIAAVLPEFTGTPEKGSINVDGTDYTYYHAEGAGYAIISTTSGFGGALTLMVGIDGQGVVHNTTVLAHSETPGLGAKCTTDAQWSSSADSTRLRSRSPSRRTAATSTPSRLRPSPRAHTRWRFPMPCTCFTN